MDLRHLAKCVMLPMTFIGVVTSDSENANKLALIMDYNDKLYSLHFR